MARATRATSERRFGRGNMKRRRPDEEEEEEEELEDLFLALGAMADQGDGGMPGAMPGGEVMVNFVDPEDVEDEGERLKRLKAEE